MVESVWIAFSGGASHTMSAPWLQPARLKRDFFLKRLRKFFGYQTAFTKITFL